MDNNQIHYLAPHEDHTDRPFGRNIYFQATDFTCGPACVMMAMAALDENYQPNHLDELMIWRQANLVMQGKPPAGCGPFGLALAAMERGFNVEVYEHKAENIILELAHNDEDKAILDVVTRYDRTKAIENGCPIHEEKISSELLKILIQQNKQLIALTFGEEDGHWVMIHDINDQHIFIIDPYKATPQEAADSKYYTDTGRNFIHYFDAKEWLHYGPNRSSVLLALDLPIKG